MTKTIVIDGKEYRMRASALTPRLYRAFFKRDMIRDMQNLLTAYNKLLTLPEDATEEEKNEANLVILDYLEVFENVAWLFCRKAAKRSETARKNGWIPSKACSPSMKSCRRS